MNNLAINMMQGDLFTSTSIDSIANDETGEKSTMFPVEYLNSLSISGMPKHILRLKIGAPLILIRNLDIKKGLCNGTRLQLLSYTPRLIGVKLLNGSHEGEETYLPRINLVSNDSDLPFELKRRQFPVQIAFCMTINKSQGQSLTTVGIWLPQPVFAHGQLYVGLSRSGIPANTKILMTNVNNRQGIINDREGFHTINIVYKEVLNT
jgi:ATP-dependent DNA helicase PIF1